MNHFILDPECAGSLGPRTEMDNTVHPPIVKKIHFEVDAWLGDEIVQTFPCYLVADILKARLKALKPTGVQFASAEITASDNFQDLSPGRTLPTLSWVKVNGEVGRDDFGLTADARLVVSERVLEEMRLSQFRHCSVKKFVA